MFNRRSRAGRIASERSRRATEVGLRALELLEERMLLASYVVLNTNDSGPGSLRDAIDTINLDSVGPNTIDFGIQSGVPGVQTIAPLTALPVITQPVRIDGYSQPGASPNTLAVGSDAVLLIQVSGQNLSFENLLQVSAGNSTIRGLVLNNLPSFGSALRISGAGGNVIEGNYVGTDAAGTAVVGVSTGILVSNSPSNTIGGLTPASRNLISGATGNNGGVFIVSPNATGNRIAGNYIGTDASGKNSLGNSFDGIVISDASGTLIGGQEPGAGNVIVGAARAGIEVFGSKVVIEGNRIGTDATGTVALGNAAAGIIVDEAAEATIGGAASASGNLISGNRQGILFTGSITSGIVQGNMIGTDVTGLSPLGNALDGIEVQGSGVTIGGLSASSGNIIAFNGGSGVKLPPLDLPPTGVAILSNTILSNAKLGIDLGGDGVTPNDPGDTDSGPNDLQNFPVVISAAPDGNGNTRITASINSTPNAVFRIQTFLNQSIDPTGFGQGQSYRVTTLGGDAFVSTDASGNASYAALYPFAIAVGQSITLTATNASNSTSEFSQAFTFASGPSFVVTNTNDTGSGSLRQVITDANATPGLQTITFNIPGQGVQTIRPNSALPTFTDPVILDASTQPGFAGVPIIQLNTVNLGDITAGSNIGLFFTTGSGGSTVRGLIINSANQGLRFGPGVDGNKVVGNYFGTDPTGTLSVPNQSSLVIASSSNNTVGGTTAADRNVIDGNTSVNISDASNANLFSGNYIGTNATGSASLPGGIVTLTFGGTIPANNTIGGLTPGSGNLISPSAGAIGINLAPATNTLVVGNLIGTDATGTARLGTGSGVLIRNAASGNSIGGLTAAARNVIAVTGTGVEISGTANRVSGNYIGTNAAGTAAFGNSGGGIKFEGNGPVATGTTIGGAEAGAGNLISGQGQGGILTQGNTTVNTLIQGNLIGTNSAGTAAMGNGGPGISIGSGSGGVTIGGAAAGAGNVISASAQVGLSVSGGTSGILVQGNKIGTDISGTIDLGNALDGIVTNSSNMTIGGTSANAGNLISGNDRAGIQAGFASGIVIQGNKIGTDASGNVALANGEDGIVTSASNTTIGGVAAGSGNIIAFNGRVGVLVGAATGVSILGNAIFSNTALGVDLLNAVLGVDPNDPGDPDTGSNNLQNFPVLSSATTNVGSTLFAGTLNTNPNTTLTIEFFANAAPDPTGFGEGQQFVGRTTVTTDASGNAAFNVSFATPSLVGNRFSSTATGPSGTSEFSAVRVGLLPGFVVTNTNDTGSGSLRQVITDANATPGLQTITFNIPGQGVQTITPTSALPAITDPVAIDAYTQPGATPNTNGPGFADNAVLLVVISGKAVPAGTDALIVSAGSTKIRGLVINGFKSSGALDGVAIRISGLGGNIIEGNFLGTDASGQVAQSNFSGITLDSPDNTIGGLTDAARNIISGNDHSGIDVFGAAASGTLIANNFVGVGADGVTPLGNADVGVLLNGNSGSTVGGTSAQARNVISGNLGFGLTITTNGGQEPSDKNLIAGNFIGTDLTGSVAVGNGSIGLFLGEGTNTNTIGGPAAGAGNVISGNRGTGLLIQGAATTGNLVAGNFIGTSATGNVAIGNGDPVGGSGYGVQIDDAPSNTIGGVGAGAGNVISGNALAQIGIAGANARFNLIAGNAIGTDVTGTVALSTANGSGISIGDDGFTPGSGASDNTIGGTVPGSGNLISGNDVSDYGILFDGPSTTRNLVVGNLIGTDVSSTAALGNGYGVGIVGGAFDNTVGGEASGARNLISGNVNANIFFNGSGANLVQGNLIGTDAAGNAALDAKATTTAGVFLDNASSGVTIGGTSAGARNVISGNAGHGIQIQGKSADIGSLTHAITVLGNYIGTNASGSTLVANGGTGILVSDGAFDNIIGGTLPEARNVISGNAKDGIAIVGALTTQNLIVGNFIGTDAAGTSDLGNGNSGVRINGPNNTIGGSAESIRSTFDTGTQGWTVTNTTPIWMPTGGNPGGFLFVDNPETTISEMVAPAQFLGDLSRFNRGILSFDGNVLQALDPPFPSYGTVTIQGSNLTVSLDIVPGDPPLNQWVTYPIDLNAATWGLSESDWESLLSNVIALRISVEAVFGREQQGFDNFVLQTSIAPGSGNVISGNAGSGILLDGSLATQNLIASNFIGTNASGTLGVPNGDSGILISNSGSNTIGGVTASARNLISANTANQVMLTGASATGNVLAGNFIGPDITGTKALTSFIGAGVILSEDGTSGSGPNGNTIGGLTTGMRNLISGNGTGAGVAFLGSSTTNNLVIGNFIGPDVSGTGMLIDGNGAPVAGNFAGVTVDQGATGNTVGGTSPSARNVLSANASGVSLSGSASGNVVLGNYIGVDVNGTSALLNFRYGVEIRLGATANTIGGSVPGSRNIVSGNRSAGVHIEDVASASNVILGNYIGTDVSGGVAVPNGSGVIVADAPDTTIGGVASGSGNVVSGNDGVGIGVGVGISGATVARTVIQGNFVGTDATGTKTLDNKSIGISVDGPNTTIGGSAPGAGNLISGNRGIGSGSNGVGLLVGRTTLGNGFGALIQGNKFGTDITGTFAIPNEIGIEIFSGGATVGGTTPGARNIISGNLGTGLDLEQFEGPSSLVLGNYIGVDVTGSKGLGNGSGLVLSASTGSITVGGTAAGAGNVISANRGAGILLIFGPVSIQGNRIGTDVTSTLALGNTGQGIRTDANDTTIGGTSAGAGNIIRANGLDGLQIQGDRTLVQGNVVTDNGFGSLLPMAGVRIDDPVSNLFPGHGRNNTIGGLTAGASNTISGNTGAGIFVQGDGATGNALLSNSIFSNKIGIDLGNDGPTPNTPGGPHVGPNLLQNKPVLTNAFSDGTMVTAIGTLNSIPSTSFTIQFFADGGDASGLAEGRVFVGQTVVTTDASGNAAINVSLAFSGVPVGAAITATATDPNGNTSEFSLDTAVRNVNDSGFGSLRQAITNANGVGESTTILFNVPSVGGPVTIAPNTPLPKITSPVFIDGYSQPGSSPNTLFIGDDAVFGVELVGTNILFSSGPGLHVVTGTSGATIRGLAIGGFGASAILVDSGVGVNISGNFLGLAADGFTPRPNIAGVELRETTGVTIGGTTPADRNVISGNVLLGITMGNAGAIQPPTNTLIANNQIGTARDGLTAVGNGAFGINLTNVVNTTIGGLSSNLRNVISGNNGPGIHFDGGFGPDNTAILGNYIGVEATGFSAVPNKGAGIQIVKLVNPASGYGVTIGNFEGGSNLIAGNTGPGLDLQGARALVQANTIGVNVEGLALGNGGSGIFLTNDAGSLIGGPTEFEGNVIAFNGGDGITTTGAPLAIVRVNTIFGNAKLGIDINNDGVTPNTPPTPLNDPNRFPNYPVLFQAVGEGSALHVTGSFDGTESVTTIIDFFSNLAADPSGFGQGQFYLGSISLTTDANGHADIDTFLPLVPDGQFLTATATSFATSEFSRAILVGSTAAPILTLTIDAAPDPVAVADVLSYRISTQNVGSADAADVTLRDSLPVGTSLTPGSRAAIEAAGGTFTVGVDGAVVFFVPLGNVAVGATKTFEFQIIADRAGLLINSASVLGQLVGPVVDSITTRSIFTFVVLNNHNAGFGSLRQAILNAGANPGVDTITFQLPDDQLAILPTASLPAIHDPTIVDASSQPGFAGSPIVTLDGSKIPAPSPEDVGPFGGLIVRNGGTTIRGLNVVKFTDNGIILIGASGSRIVGNFLGGNDTGLLIQGSSGNTIGGTTPADRNVISANSSLGVDINRSSRNVFLGNYVGLDATGTQPLGNGINGLFFDNSPDNTVGGVVTGSRNVISANRQVNIQIFGSGSARNVIAGNLIGLDATGTSRVSTSGNLTDVGIFVNAAPANTIGGTTPEARNVVSGAGAGIELYTSDAVANVVSGNYTGTDISGARPIANSIGIFLFGSPGNTVSGNVASGNTQVGIRIDGTTGSNNVIVGNTVGLDASGTSALPNEGDGIFIVNAPGNIIGGTTPALANVLTGNRSVGIQLFGPDSAANVVQGNLIGVARNGTEPGNGAVGVFLNNSPRNTIGGTVAGSGNTIAGNRQAGIQIAGRSAVGNVILGNTLRNNPDIGIASENATENLIEIRGANANTVTGSAIAFQPVPTPGPTASVLTTKMTGGSITGVSLTFDASISPARARDKRAYRVEILNLRGRRIGMVMIRSASFDNDTHTATLTFSRPVSAARSYRLIAMGQGPRAITDTSGRALDGARTGGSGTNFVARFGNLAARPVAIASRSVPTFRKAGFAATGHGIK